MLLICAITNPMDKFTGEDVLLVFSFTLYTGCNALSLSLTLNLSSAKFVSNYDTAFPLLRAWRGVMWHSLNTRRGVSCSMSPCPLSHLFAMLLITTAVFHVQFWVDIYALHWHFFLPLFFPVRLPRSIACEFSCLFCKKKFKECL